LYVFSEVIAKSSVTVAEQEARELVKGKCFSQLLLRSTPRSDERSHCSAGCDVGHGPTPETRRVLGSGS
jgi:hypothetical protein